MQSKSGREVTPMPIIRKNKRFIQYDILKLCEWLLMEGTKEAVANKDRNSEYLFINMNKNLTLEDFNLVSKYVFGFGVKGFEPDNKLRH
jgi:hypothetical protein